MPAPLSARMLGLSSPGFELTEAFPSDSRLRRSAGLLASGKHVGNNNGLPLEGPRVRSKRATLAPAYAIEGD